MPGRVFRGVHGGRISASVSGGRSGKTTATAKTPGNHDVVSMPDKWEYPWYAAWDLAFHCIPLAMVDPDFAKSQLDLMLSEGYLHSTGQMPAYEWNFGDVNPPVHAMATSRRDRTTVISLTTPR